MQVRTLFLITVLQLLALWPVWRWYASRVINSHGDEYGLLALGTAIFLLWVRQIKTTQREITLSVPIFFLLSYGFLYRFVPSEIEAAIAFSTLAVLLSMFKGRRWPEIGILGLFLLSLPLIPSLQFYLGYPMRVLVAVFTIPILRLGGFEVVREGTCLLWGTKLVWIDAPCSGIRMLWVGGYLLFTLTSIYRLSAFRTITAGVLALLLVVASNILRSASLFYLEADVIELPSGFHDAVGIVVFCFLSGLIFFVVHRLHEHQTNRLSERDKQHVVASSSNAEKTVFSLKSIYVCIIVSLFVGLIPMLPLCRKVQCVNETFPGWPDAWNDRPLTLLELSEREARFMKNFPGQTARFTDGHHEIIMRWVTVPTRKLHPASDCFRAYGAKIRPFPLYIDEQDKAWGAFQVEQNGCRLLVHEQFRDNTGQTWSDVSSWYWASTFGKTKGPWWVFVVVEKL